jgi:signal transduction histidine kinase
MDKSSGQLVFSEMLTRDGRQPLGRQILALDALSKLTQQFCDEPDFERLIDTLLATLCGQFAVGNAFALLRKPSSQALDQSFFGTGTFKEVVLLSSIQLTREDVRYFFGPGKVHRVTDLASSGDPDGLISTLKECGVNIICLLVHNDEFLGMIGLGDRVTQKPYEEEDKSLLNKIMNTITPLVANCYLFWEIASLNAWYLDILNNVKQGVFVFDRNYRLKKANSAGLMILDTFGPGLSGMDRLVDAPIESVFPEEVFGGWATQIVESRPLKQETTVTRVVAKTGPTKRVYNVSVTGTVENTEMGTALIITLDDVTVLKENEERLFDLQKFADKGLMASSISHELNNFLTLVLGGVELMELALATGNSEKVAATLNKLKANVANVERFTKAMTDYTRLDSSKQLANLSAIVSDLLSFVSVQKRFKRIIINANLDRNMPDLEVDADQIAQVLLNLLNNGIDAIDESGRKDGEITIMTARDNGNAILSVSDNGTGMLPEVKERLFKSNFTTKQSGHGYGLVTCAKIIENHRGSVDVDSQAGQGTTFTVRFPLPAAT